MRNTPNVQVIALTISRVSLWTLQLLFSSIDAFIGDTMLSSTIHYKIYKWWMQSNIDESSVLSIRDTFEKKCGTGNIFITGSRNHLII